MVDIIVRFTNLYIERNFGGSTDSKKDKRNVGNTNREEIMALICILFLLGVKKCSKLNLAGAWSEDGTGIEILQGVMGVNKFKFLISCVRFDDKITRSDRRKTDKLAPIRELYDSFVANCQTSYSPGEHLTIDEKSEPFRGNCSFIQYIPNNPTKYGLKIFAIVDSLTFYTLGLEVYYGAQPPGPYQVPNSSHDIVHRLISKWKGSHRNVTTNN